MISIKHKRELYDILKICNHQMAFTLAEVLITLGIIGVVAALTIPSLIAKYQKQVTVNKLKATYSIINQAIKLAEVENGPYSTWEKGADIGDANDFFNKYFKPYYKETTICNPVSVCGYKYIESNCAFKRLDGQLFRASVYSGSDRLFFRLPNGATFFYIFITTNSLGQLVYTTYFYVDINGGKGPNVIGKDVFSFDFKNSGGIVPRGYDKTQSQIDSDCSKNSSGGYCAAKIMNDGWEIKY